ncbi:MAG: hypothetical protein ACYC7J_00160 [Syntrophales bacterium]
MPNERSIHLCQPDAGMSCGACCGIYNYADSSPEALRGRLRRRTARFRGDVRGRDDLTAFARTIRLAEDQTRRFDVIYCCEYVGFLDPGERRVGCLLHPAQNGGVDLRGVSFYGRDLCDGHLCPSHQFLSPAEQTTLVEILDDWYLYGLCITDIDLVKGYFRHIGECIGGTPRPEMFREGPAREIARRFFAFKLDWPFRSPESNRWGRFSFDGSEHRIRPIDYAAIGGEPSRYDGIFLSLCSRFRDREQLRRAEGMIRENVEAAAAACEGPS